MDDLYRANEALKQRQAAARQSGKLNQIGAILTTTSAPDLPLLQPQTEGEPLTPHAARVDYLAALLRAAGVQIDAAALDQAKAGTLPAVREDNDPAVDCPQCGGVGSVKIAPDAEWDDPQFGKMMPCPAPAHYGQRQAAIARLSGLSIQQLAIRLSDCREYHRANETVDVGLRDAYGNSVPVARSNRKMLESYRALVVNPFRYPFVYVWGPWGGGKTHASIALINELNEARRGPAMFIAWQDLLAWIKASFDDRNRVGDFGNWSQDQRYDLLATIPVLVVDEFDFDAGKTQESEWNLSLMQRWLNARYQAGIDGRATTIFISNSAPESLGLGGVISRLDDTRNLKLLNTAPDFRKAQR